MIKLNIKRKLLISFILISVLPMFIIGLLSYYKSIQAIKSKISTLSFQTINETSKNINTKVEAIEKVLDEIMVLDLIQNGLDNYSNMDDVQKSNLLVNINNFLNNKYTLINHITDVEIITKNDEFFYNFGYGIFDKNELERFSTKAYNLGGSIGWSPIYLKNRFNIAAYRTINKGYTQRPIGYVIMSINQKYFSDIYKDLKLGLNTDIFIINSEGFVLSSINPNIPIGLEYQEKNLMKNVKNNNNSHDCTLKINNQRYLFTYSSIKNTDWYLVGAIPYSYLTKEADEIRKHTFIIMTIGLIISILLSIIISKTIFSPLDNLVEVMQEAKEGNFQIKLDYNKEDEIKYIADHFNIMIKEIHELIIQLEKEQKCKREAELKMLQAQINPHFLFNTLNSLKWTATISQSYSVADGISALAELLRNTIVDKEEFIPIIKEIDNIKNYIIIQRIRYGEDFVVEYNVEESLYQYKIIKFLLQPIVENSIIHGFNNIDYQGKISINIKKIDDKDMEIKVIDNGKGLTENTIKQILNIDYKSKNQLSNIGLSNVKERITLNFGKSYSMNIYSQADVGTTVIINLPLISK